MVASFFKRRELALLLIVAIMIAVPLHLLTVGSVVALAMDSEVNPVTTDTADTADTSDTPDTVDTPNTIENSDIAVFFDNAYPDGILMLYDTATEHLYYDEVYDGALNHTSFQLPETVLTRYQRPTDEYPQWYDCPVAWDDIKSLPLGQGVLWLRGTLQPQEGYCFAENSGQEVFFGVLPVSDGMEPIVADRCSGYSKNWLVELGEALPTVDDISSYNAMELYYTAPQGPDEAIDLQTSAYVRWEEIPQIDNAVSGKYRVKSTVELQPWQELPTTAKQLHQDITVMDPQTVSLSYPEWSTFQKQLSFRWLWQLPETSKLTIRYRFEEDAPWETSGEAVMDSYDFYIGELFMWSTNMLAIRGDAIWDKLQQTNVDLYLQLQYEEKVSEEVLVKMTLGSSGMQDCDVGGDRDGTIDDGMVTMPKPDPQPDDDNADDDDDDSNTDTAVTLPDTDGAQAALPQAINAPANTAPLPTQSAVPDTVTAAAPPTPAVKPVDQPAPEPIPSEPSPQAAPQTPRKTSGVALPLLATVCGAVGAWYVFNCAGGGQFGGKK